MNKFNVFSIGSRNDREFVGTFESTLSLEDFCRKRYNDYFDRLERIGVDVDEDHKNEFSGVYFYEDPNGIYDLKDGEVYGDVIFDEEDSEEIFLIS